VAEATNHALKVLYSRQVQSTENRFSWHPSSVIPSVNGTVDTESDSDETVNNVEDHSNKYRYFGRHKSFSLPHRWRSDVVCNDNERNTTASTFASRSIASSCVCRQRGGEGEIISQMQGTFQCKNVNPNEFRRRKGMMAEWFEQFDDEQKILVLRELMKHCGTPQNHFLSVVMEPKLHKYCPPNCRDILSWLPASISHYILSFLDPVSLCQCLRVCRVWQGLANHPALWQRFCGDSRWQLSPAAERKQMSCCRQTDGSIQWKKVFSERYRLMRNWMSGSCHVRTFEGHTQG